VCVCLVRHLVEVVNRNRTENKWKRGSRKGGRGVSGASAARHHHCQGGIVEGGAPDPGSHDDVVMTSIPHLV
jgi:hypothetical protein